MSTPNDPVLESAKRALVARDFARAESIAESLLKSHPDTVEAILIQAICAMETERPQPALRLFQVSLTLNPDNLVAMQRLPLVLRRLGRYAEAETVAARAVALWPEDARLLNTLGLCYLTVHKVEQAIACFRSAIAISPRVASFHHNLGTALNLLREDPMAAEAYSASIALDGAAEESRSALILLMLSHGDNVAALQACREALTVRPDSANFHLLCSGILRELLEHEEAELHLQTALRLDPRKTAAAGMQMHEEGRFEEAKSNFSRALELNSSDVLALVGLTQGKRLDESDWWIVERMDALITGGSLPPSAQASLHYALGKAHDDLGLYEVAMGHFDEANRISFYINLAGRGFDAAKHRDDLNGIKDIFSAGFLARHRRVGSESELPIFIIGMIRSGTTLTEQMISSHPLIGAAGEQKFWMSDSPKALDILGKALDEELLRVLQTTYLQIIERYAPAAKRITDKMPLNFLWAGLIHLAFPRARIIHVRRSPIDTCLSIYVTALAKAPDFAYNKDNIVAGYREYQGMMDHWRQVLPGDRLYEFDYESLVASPGVVLRSLIAFCGLEWDDACLHHASNNRRVTTPSAWQVRQPVYTTSVERWRKYEPWLGALATLLPNE
ncbi:MAG: sulfotransferase [Fimbriimonadaceae bacterium]